MVPGVVCLYCGGAGDEVYTDPPEEELLYAEVDARIGFGALSRVCSLIDLEVGFLSLS